MDLYLDFDDHSRTTQKGAPWTWKKKSFQRSIGSLESSLCWFWSLWQEVYLLEENIWHIDRQQQAEEARQLAEARRDRHGYDPGGIFH